MDIASFIPLILLIAAIYWVVKRPKGNKNQSINKPEFSKQNMMICKNCGTQGSPNATKKGSTGIELVLWLCAIIPGLIYSIWRRSGINKTQMVCPACGQPGMIGIDTPNGRMLAERTSASI